MPADVVRTCPPVTAVLLCSYGCLNRNFHRCISLCFARRFRCLLCCLFWLHACHAYTGEWYDLPSDKLNVYAGPLTGGSKVLVSGDVTPRQCFALGYACMVTSVAVLAYALPRRCWLIGSVLIFIAHQYSAPPFKFNHRGLGEMGATLASNVLLPQFAALVQSALFEVPAWCMFHSSLAVLIVPALFTKFGLFLALNMADRRPDWLGGKYTLPVLLGDEPCARYVFAHMCGALVCQL